MIYKTCNIVKDGPACKAVYLGFLSTVNTGIRISCGVFAPTEAEINLLYFIQEKAPHC